jgi:rod shape-determining protein MreD
MNERGAPLKAGRLALLLVVGVILQTVVVSRLTVLGVSADVYLVLVVLVALGNGPLTGVVFGFCAGLLADVLFLEPIGLRTLIYLMAGYAVGRYGEEFGFTGAWSAVLAATVVSLVAGLGYGVMQFVIGPQQGFFTMLRTQVLPQAVFNGLLAAPLYLGLLRLRLVGRAVQTGPSYR